MIERVRLNLGAGAQDCPGWINYDQSRAVLIARSPVLRRLVRLAHRAGLATKSDLLQWPENTRVHDVTKGLPHPPDSVDVIFSSHMLEHLWPDQAQFILEECHRVLKPGGALRLIVPDLEVITRAYVEKDHHHLRTDSTTPIADAYMEELAFHTPPKGGVLERMVRRGLRTEDGGHKWMYDGESLAHRCRNAGFIEVRRVTYGEGRDQEAAQLDTRSSFHVHLEAFKDPGA